MIIRTILFSHINGPIVYVVLCLFMSTVYLFTSLARASICLRLDARLVSFGGFVNANIVGTAEGLIVFVFL